MDTRRLDWPDLYHRARDRQESGPLIRQEGGVGAKVLSLHQARVRHNARHTASRPLVPSSINCGRRPGVEGDQIPSGLLAPVSPPSPAAHTPPDAAGSHGRGAGRAPPLTISTPSPPLCPLPLLLEAPSPLHHPSPHPPPQPPPP